MNDVLYIRIYDKSKSGIHEDIAHACPQLGVLAQNNSAAGALAVVNFTVQGCICDEFN